jgi:hypothetical protein
LEWLHEREKKAGVRKSIVVETQKKDVFMIVGSKYWKDSCWKIMLYTYFVRCISVFEDPNKPTQSTNEDTYRDSLNKKSKKGISKEDVFLSQVKNPVEIFDKTVFTVKEDPNYWGNGEKIKTFVGWHDYEGFHSICTGKNAPMAKHLGFI